MVTYPPTKSKRFSLQRNNNFRPFQTSNVTYESIDTIKTKAAAAQQAAAQRNFQAQVAAAQQAEAAKQAAAQQAAERREADAQR